MGLLFSRYQMVGASISVILLVVHPTRSSAATEYTQGPAALSCSLIAKIIVGATVEIDPSTGKQIIDPSTRKPIPALYSTGAKNFDRAGRVASTTDTYAGKILGARYGNPEFLADLLSAGVLGDTQIKGWGIFAVRSGDSYRIEARKQGTSIDLSDYISMRTTPIASNHTRKQTTTYNNAQPDTTTGQGNFTQEGGMQLFFRELSDAQGTLIPEFSLTGTMIITGSEYRWYPNLPKRYPQTHIDLRTSVKMNGLVGAYQPAPDDMSGNSSLFVTGSASLGPESAVLKP